MTEVTKSAVKVEVAKIVNNKSKPIIMSAKFFLLILCKFVKINGN